MAAVESGILAMPLEVMILILRCLPPSPRARCRQVCVAWRDIASEATLWREFSPVKFGALYTDRSFERFASSGYYTRAVQRLILGGSQVTDKTARLVVALCPNLQLINVQKTQVTHDGVVALIEGIPTLQTVNAIGVKLRIATARQYEAKLGMKFDIFGGARSHDYCILGGEVVSWESIDVRNQVRVGRHSFATLFVGTTVFGGVRPSEEMETAVIISVDVVKQNYRLRRIFNDNMCLLEHCETGALRELILPRHLRGRPFDIDEQRVALTAGLVVPAPSCLVATVATCIGREEITDVVLKDA